MGSWSLVKKKDSMFDGLAKQSEKDAERIREKQEKVKEQKKAEEKKFLITASSNKELLVRAKAALTGEERALGRGVDHRV